ncbi:hypothetical protein [Microbacterium sp. 1P10AE]|uniref:hypothetical protein n=1 Tax=Microbacterium sp. 1P10AE TaxID=3132286 RepID=UPI0039A1750E
MTKRRFLTPEEMQDEDLGEQTPTVRFVAIALRMLADDEGRARLNVRSIKGQAFTNDQWTSEDVIETSVLVLEEIGFIRSYVVAGRQYFQVTSRYHTPPEKPKRSEIPPPPPLSEPSGRHPDGVPIRGGREGAGSRGGTRPDSIPTTCPRASAPSTCLQGREGSPAGCAGMRA